MCSAGHSPVCPAVREVRATRDQILPGPPRWPSVGAELPPQPGFCHPGLAKTTPTNHHKKKKKNKSEIPELDGFIYIFYTHTWGPIVSGTIQGCALEVPLKVHPFLLVPSWKPSFKKTQVFFLFGCFLYLLLPLKSIPQTTSPPFKKAAFQKALLVADILLPN